MKLTTSHKILCVLLILCSSAVSVAAQSGPPAQAAKTSLRVSLKKVSLELGGKSPNVVTRPEMKVVQEDIFGPVVTAIPFKDAEEVLLVTNDTVYGLAAGVWTRDINKAHQVAAELRAGTVWINCYNVNDVSMPFGGYKQSGWGREPGKDVLELYTEVKAICARLQ